LARSVDFSEDDLEAARRRQPRPSNRLTRRWQSCRVPGLHVAQHLHEADHVARLKNPFHSIAVKISEGAFIQKRWIHDAASREVIDYEIEELQLVCAKPPAQQEFTKGTFRALSHCRAKSASGLRLADFQAAAMASRHVVIAAARSTRCD
jgi:hypothetical protein